MGLLVRVFLLGILFLPLLSKAEKNDPGDEILVFGPTTGCPPLTTTFYPSYYEDFSDPFVSWSWDFGDGETSTDFSPTHTYNIEGEFTVTVVATTVSGAITTITAPGLIKTSNSFSVNLGPDASFCSGSSITLDATVSGASDYLWEDGSTTPTTDRFFEGEYSVAVTKGGCVARDTIYVSQTPLISADFDYNFTPGCSPIATSFTEMSQSCAGPIVSWEWDFGDGNTSTDQNPVHDYAAPGDYLVMLTVKNSIGSVYATNKTVTIEGTVMPTVELGDDQVICEGFTGTLVATGSGGPYVWSTGETTSSIVVDASGKYYVTVNVDGCEASDTVNVSILPDLIVNFSATQL
ncbi:MAG: PKD domain-containing protein, partial [Chitinophagaceae bacterium]|nr:PKD domain-containing protein [Chitinophagaceae bacterium]